MTERRFVPALDGVRGIAILYVVASHFATIQGLKGTNPFAHGLVKFAAAGWTGVNLFFVLSGFLITGILIEARGTDSYFRSFFARRALRIWPVYFGWLFVIFVVFPAVGLGAGENYEAARRHQAWYWTHLTNVMMALREIVPRPEYPTTHLWSLAVEEQFYLFWPVVVLLTPPRLLLRICLIGAALSFAGRALASGAGVPNEALYVITPLRLEALLLGGAAAVFLRDAYVAERARWLIRASAVGGAIGIVAIILINGRFEYRDFLTATFGDVFLALLSVSLVMAAALALPGSLADRVLSVAPLRSVGKYSYTMYIVHTAVVRQFTRYLPFDTVPPLFGSLALSQTLYFLAYVAEVYLVALLSWHLVEKPFLRLKRLVPYGRAPQAHLT